MREAPGGERVPTQESFLVGREREIQVLAAALQEAIAGDGGLFMLLGEAGAGKTSLAENVAAQARPAGVVVLRGRCWEGGGAPVYWPWTQVVRGLIDELGEDAFVSHLGTNGPLLGHIVPEVRRLQGDVERGPEPERFALFDAVGTFLRSVARSRPLLIVLEDLHAADEPSLHLLDFAARSLKGTRILILGTYDDGHARQEGGVEKLLGRMSVEGRRLHLGRISAEAVASLYRRETELSPPEGIVTALLTVSEGNPFFVKEAVRLFSDEGDIHRPDRSLGFRVPQGVREVLLRRLEPLDSSVLNLLSVASVLGREFDLVTLKEATGMDEAKLVDLLSQAIRSGVVREISAVGRYAFSHVLIRETLYEELSVAERMKLHNLIGEALEEHYREDLEPHLEQLAHHFFKAAQAGDRNKTIDYSLRAAQRAESLAAFEEAARLYARALKVADLLGLPPARRQQILNSLKAAEERSESHAFPTEDDAGDNRFSNEGEFWTLVFQGKTSRLKNTKGLHYLSKLLQNPGRELHSLDLAGLIEGRPPASRSAVGRAAERDLLADAWGDAGNVLDARAKAAYKRRIEELQQDLTEAEDFNDPERAAKAQAEMDALIQQLATAVGLGGRDRKAASQVERARMSVTRAVRSAISRIEDHDPSLGAHLAATVKTGIFCSYTPDPRAPIAWEVSG